MVSLNGSESASTLSISSPKGHNFSRQRTREPQPPLHSTSAVSADEVVDESVGEDKMQPLEHCGILQNACLPCLASPSGDKRINPATPSLRRKVLSFKWREGHSAATTATATATAADPTPTLCECCP